MDLLKSKSLHCPTLLSMCETMRNISSDTDCHRSLTSVQTATEWTLWRSDCGQMSRRTNIMLAAYHGNIMLLRQLCEASTCVAADVNMQSPDDGATALHAAANCVRSDLAVDAIQLLLQHGADPKLKDSDGYRALDLLTTGGQRGDQPYPRSDGGDSTEDQHVLLQPEGPPFESNGLSEEDRQLFSTPDFRMYHFKVDDCPNKEHKLDHDWTACPYAHPGEKAKRRDPKKHSYTSVACPDFRKGTCKRGDVCPYAHGVFESWLHPSKYSTQLCKEGEACARCVCFFAHSLEELRESQEDIGLASLQFPLHPPRCSSLNSSLCWGSCLSDRTSSPGRTTLSHASLRAASLTGHSSAPHSLAAVSGKDRGLLAPASELHWLGTQPAPAGHVMKRLAATTTLTQRLEQLKVRTPGPVRSSLPSSMGPHGPPPPRRVSASAVPTASCYQGGNFWTQRAPAQRPDQAAYFNPGASPGSVMVTPRYPPAYTASPEAFNLTNPLIAGALQAGVLPQLLAQLSLQQLALLGQTDFGMQQGPSYDWAPASPAMPAPQCLTSSLADMLLLQGGMSGNLYASSGNSEFGRAGPHVQASALPWRPEAPQLW